MTGTSRAFLAFLAASVFSLFPLSGSAQVDCTVLPQWVKLDNGSLFNQRHVFCGEWKGNRAKGFHSRPGGINPAVVSNFTVQDSPDSAGIYTGKWSFKDHPGRSKFSTMFPDSCSTSQILNSISYASAHPESSCPEGSPGWAKCGKNWPGSDAQEDAGGYCTNNGEFFLIGFAPPVGDRINTAFPIRQ